MGLLSIFGLGLPFTLTPVGIVFSLNTLMALFTAFNVLAQRNPIYSALFLIANFFTLAVYYLLLDAQFLAAVQIIVYAGAIMVLFLFVITLLSPGREEAGEDRLRVLRVPMTVLVAALGLVLVVLLMYSPILGQQGTLTRLGTVQIVGSQLYRGFIFPFELTSLLLLVAMLGAVVLAKRRVD